MPVIRVNQHFRLTLPMVLREQLHLLEGDLLEATVRDNEIVLKPTRLPTSQQVIDFYRVPKIRCLSKNQLDQIIILLHRNMWVIGWLKPVTDIDHDIETAITEGLHNYEGGRVVGPFANIQEFKTVIANS